MLAHNKLTTEGEVDQRRICRNNKFPNTQISFDFEQAVHSHHFSPLVCNLLRIYFFLTYRMSSLKDITAEEVAAHKAESDFWIIVDGLVYAFAQDFLDSHPGGPVILDAAGRDGSVLFEDAGHGDGARAVLKDYCIGRLKK